jgi:ubiquinone/menaquinone biosynthesis C-methylase UbiE
MTLKSSIFNIFQQFYEVFKVQIPKIGISEQELLQWNQFCDDKNLALRIEFYRKYSTNKQGFIPWLFDRYCFAKNDSILELGCGNGNQWKGRIEQLPEGCKLVLSDFSDGMLNKAKEIYPSFNENVSCQKIDIQSIPYDDESFDVVIANHMLFHVSNLYQALSEVRRVLRTGGHFYSATDSIDGMRPFLHEAIKRFDPKTKVFTDEISLNLQNGSQLLQRYFSFVEKHVYKDILAVTNTQDLMDWLESTISISGYSEKEIIGLNEYFETIRRSEGTINIPKESGLFISVKGS